MARVRDCEQTCNCGMFKGAFVLVAVFEIHIIIICLQWRSIVDHLLQSSCTLSSSPLGLPLLDRGRTQDSFTEQYHKCGSKECCTREQMAGVLSTKKLQLIDYLNTFEALMNRICNFCFPQHIVVPWETKCGIGGSIQYVRSKFGLFDPPPPLYDFILFGLTPPP